MYFRSAHGHWTKDRLDLFPAAKYYLSVTYTYAERDTPVKLERRGRITKHDWAEEGPGQLRQVLEWYHHLNKYEG